MTKIGAQGAADIGNIKAQGEQDRKRDDNANRLEARTRASQSQYARSLAGMF